jgi:serine/threonine protein kinase
MFAAFNLTPSVPRTEEQVVMIMRDVIRGIHYLHSQGVMHLDLKIKNVVLVSGRAKVIDFGGCSRLINPRKQIGITIPFRPPGMSKIF